MERRLPLGIQDFAKIREENLVYVDKTAIIHRLISSPSGAFFLSRPRRFGKTLLCSILRAIFEGKRELFQGLAIDSLAWEWKKHPVIRINLDAANYAEGIATLKSDLKNILDNASRDLDIQLRGDLLSVQFSNLIQDACKKYGEKTVVIIDEYDNPLLSTLDNEELHLATRNELKSFYSALKASDESLRFVFLTGVTKFSQVSVFSGLNHLVDLTMNVHYSNICGLTQEEVEQNFNPYITSIAEENSVVKQEVLDMIKHWYNGFSWDGKIFVYNPFSTLLLFFEKTFSNYWFATGTPTFLIDIIKKRNDVRYLLEPVELDSNGLNTFDYKTLDTALLLFQSGYLTVKSIKQGGLGIPPMYTLGVPNNEVRDSLLRCMVSSYAEYPVSDTAILRDRMRKQLFDGDEKAFENSAKALFAGIPHQLHIPQEAYYHSLLLLWLNLLGFEVQAEVSTNKGRIDAVLTWENQVVIAEIKFAGKGAAEPLLRKALAQIHEKGYYEQYNADYKKTTLLAIGFSGKNIACKIECM